MKHPKERKGRQKTILEKHDVESVYLIRSSLQACQPSIQPLLIFHRLISTENRGQDVARVRTRMGEREREQACVYVCMRESERESESEREGKRRKERVRER